MADGIPQARERASHGAEMEGVVPTAENALRKDYLGTIQKHHAATMSSRVPADKPPSGRNKWTIDFPDSQKKAAGDKSVDGRIQSPDYANLPIEQATIKNDGNHFHIRLRDAAEIKESTGDKVRFSKEFSGKVTTSKDSEGKINKIVIEPDGESVKVFGRDRTSSLPFSLEARIVRLELDDSFGDGKMRVVAIVEHPISKKDSKQPAILVDSAKFNDLAGWIKTAREANPRRSNIVADVKSGSNPKQKIDY